MVKDYVPEGGLLNTDLPLVEIHSRPGVRPPVKQSVSRTMATQSSSTLLPQQQVYLDNKWAVSDVSIQQLLEYGEPTALEEVTGPSLARRILFGPSASAGMYQGTPDTRIESRDVPIAPSRSSGASRQQEAPEPRQPQQQQTSRIIAPLTGPFTRQQVGIMMHQNAAEDDEEDDMPPPMAPPPPTAGGGGRRPYLHKEERDAFLWDDVEGEDAPAPTNGSAQRDGEESSHYSGLGALTDTTRILQSFGGGGGMGRGVQASPSGLKKQKEAEESLLPMPTTGGDDDQQEYVFGQSGIIAKKPAPAAKKGKTKVAPEPKAKAKKPTPVPEARAGGKKKEKGSRPTTPQPAGSSGKTSRPGSRLAGAKSAPPPPPLSEDDPQYILNIIAAAKSAVPVPAELQGFLGTKVIETSGNGDEGPLTLDASNSPALPMPKFLRAALYLAMEEPNA